MTHAAARAGARLLFVSQAAGRPDLYRPAEDAGVHELGTERGRPNRAAGRPPARLDGVPHRGHVAARQGLRAADAGAAPRRSGALPGCGAEHRPHRCRRPGYPGHHQRDHRLAAAAVRRPAFAAASGSQLVAADSRRWISLPCKRIGDSSSAGTRSRRSPTPRVDSSAAGSMPPVRSDQGPTRASGGGPLPRLAPSDRAAQRRDPRAWRVSSTTDRSAIPGLQCYRPRRGAARTVDPDHAGRPDERIADGRAG